MLERKHIEAIKRAHGRVHFYQSMNVPGAIEDLTAAINAALAACDESPWRTMDSAPKDGTDIIVLVNGEAHEGGWVTEDDFGESARNYHGWWSTCGGLGDEPTHWMPLPAAPEVKP